MSASKPVRNLVPPESIRPETDRAARALLQRVNARHLERNPGDSRLAARIASYELAARMQLSVPAVTDLGTEPVPDSLATPEAHAKHVKAEIEKWGPIIKKAGVYAD